MAEYKDEPLEVMEEDKDIEKDIGIKLRNGFIRKVYGIIFFQLLITTAVVYYVMVNESIMKLMLENTWFVYLTFFLSLGVMLLTFCTKLFQQVPINYLLLTLFTVLESIMVSYTTIYFDPFSVFVCAGITMILVFGLTMYACFTKRDLTMMGGFLVCFSLVLFILGIVGIFFRSYFYHVFLDSMGVLLMSLYLIYDTQLVVGQKQNLIKMDLYILGAMMIYLDIIGLFLRILRLFGNKKK